MSSTTVQESPAPYGKSLARATEIGEQRVILHGVTWATFEALLRDSGNQRSTRFAFDNGELEIMSPLKKHERSNLRIQNLIVVLCDELNIEFESLGGLTCKREDLNRGIEPDSCFYIQSECRVRFHEEIDLQRDPPPDLMVEVDISGDSKNKLPICEALGVPEHWRYAGGKLEIRVLRAGVYVEVEESPTFPGLPLKTAIPDYIQQRKTGQLSAIRGFRKWVREVLRKQRKRNSGKP